MSTIVFLMWIGFNITHQNSDRS